MSEGRPRPDAAGRLYTQHARRWASFDYVYPVISRRSRGLSVGVNLNVDAACNFDCIYCQVDRTNPPRRRDVDPAQLRDELAAMIQTATTGAIWSDPAFADTPLALRRFADIAFSGDGEPTAHPAFAQACAIAAELRQQHTLSTTAIVIITNATRLNRPEVQRAIATLDAHGGVVWAKLDAGTEAYFQRVDRPRGRITLEQVTANIAAEARRRPLVIQSMWLAVDGQPPGDGEFNAYLQRLAMILDAGGQIDRVQLYTLARAPAESNVAPLNPTQLDALAQRVRERFDELTCEAFYAPD